MKENALTHDGEFTGECNLKWYEINMWHIKWNSKKTFIIYTR